MTNTEILESRLTRLRVFVREKSRLADKSAQEWKDGGAKEQSAYRSGMWYAYRQIENMLGSDIMAGVPDE